MLPLPTSWMPEPEPFLRRTTRLGGTLRVAWVADPDDNPVELVERRS